MALWDGGGDLRLLNISQVAPHTGGTEKGEKAISVSLYDSNKKKKIHRVGERQALESAYHRKAWCTNSPTLISAVSFYIHHVSIICLYGNRLGSRPNVFSPPLL